MSALLLDIPLSRNCKDYSGKRNHGTVGGVPNWVCTKYGPALNTGASAGYVVGGLVNGGIGTSDLTCEVWIQGAETNACFLSLGTQGNDVRMQYGNTGVIFVHGGDINGMPIVPSSAVFDGRPHQLVGRRVGGIMSIFLDGVFKGSVTQTVRSITSTFRIGGAEFSGSTVSIPNNTTLFGAKVLLRGKADAEILRDYQQFTRRKAAWWWAQQQYGRRRRIFALGGI